jgi:hypothetical protein
MDRLILLLAGVIALGFYFVIAPVVMNTYRRYRNRKTVICPDTGQIAEVELKAARASLLSAFGKHWVRVKWCSLWPRKKGCAEECVRQYWSAERHKYSARTHRSKPN